MPSMGFEFTFYFIIVKCEELICKTNIKLFKLIKKLMLSSLTTFNLKQPGLSLRVVLNRLWIRAYSYFVFFEKDYREHFRITWKYSHSIMSFYVKVRNNLLIETFGIIRDILKGSKIKKYDNILAYGTCFYAQLLFKLEQYFIILEIK